MAELLCSKFMKHQVKIINPEVKHSGIYYFEDSYKL